MFIMKTKESKKVLVIQQKMIGDVLISSLICENLKLHYPAYQVHYLVNRFTLPVVENNPYIDKIILFEDEYKKRKWKLFKFLLHIRAQKYEVVVDAYGKIESNLVTAFSCAKVKIGWEKIHHSFIYTITRKISRHSSQGLGSAIENRLNLVKAYLDTPIVHEQPRIYLTEEEILQAKIKIERTTNYEKIVMISALGSNEAKTYPLQYMATVLDEIVQETQAKLLLNYMPKQREIIEELIKLCNSQTQKAILKDIIFENLREFIAVTYHCKALIGNEGGAINMGKAIQVPTFSIFSPQILKSGWNGFENSLHTSVHISDYSKEIPIDVASKDNETKYHLLKPSLFMTVLKTFLATHVN